jgi:20S proteasome alpha/beta subunit
MTVHIAIASRNDAVLFSDSQLSTSNSESHQFHKQFVGGNFLIGAAGLASVIVATFNMLRSKFGVDSCPKSADVANAIEDFIENDVRQQYWDQVRFLLVSTDPTCSVRSFSPGLFKRFGGNENFASIGSGSDFVNRALNRHSALGIALPMQELPDMFATTAYFAEVANESLTVDDLLTVAILSNGRSYLLGEKAVRIQHAPPQLIADWNTAATTWDEIAAMIDQINAEVFNAQRSFNAIRTGGLIPPNMKQIESSNVSVAKLRSQLTAKISDFRVWYDKLVGRP